MRGGDGVRAGVLAPAAVGIATLIAAATAPVTGPAGSMPKVSLAAATHSWTVYHGDGPGSGADTSGVTFSPPVHAWTSPVLDGKVYGEPLESTGRVVVATENDTVYALAADTGSVLWASHVGTPVPSSSLPCGNISPTVGITGTPVIDEARGEVFAVADEVVGGAIEHHLVGLNVFTGNIELNQQVDPPGSLPSAQLQRTGLNLSGGRVVFGFGGNYGDCSTYHGFVITVPEDGGTQTTYEVESAAGQSRGAIWMGGAAPEVDASGNIWVASGNGSSSSGSPDGSDSVLELSAQLTLDQFFAPSTWASDNSADADLGSSAPALLSNGTVLQVGKSQTAFLLSQSHLGGIGGQIAALTGVCNGNDADGGDAVSGTVVYVPCGGGVQAFQTGTGSISRLWTAASAESGPPILAGGLVWSIGGGTLYGADPANGQTVEQVPVGGEANSFPTPSVGDGLLLAPSTDQVHAFSGSAGIPGPPDPAPAPPPNSSYWLVAADGGVFTFGSASYFGSTGGEHLNAPVVGMAARADRAGYWLVASDGGVFNFGGAGFFGSKGAQPLNAPVVGVAATPDGGGYWLVASDGGVFNFGGAGFHGSKGAEHLNEPVVGIAATPTGHGYWLVAADGGVFNFGDAGYFGSTGNQRLNEPVVGMAATPTGHGYWLVAADGGIFNFGDAGYFGSTGAQHLNAAMVGMAASPSGGGYWLVASDGGIFNFGDANFGGSKGAAPLNKPVVGMASAS